jgi:pyruvate-formate lyase
MAGLLGLDDDMRLALMTAGLGTLAGRGGPMRAAGQGGLLGVASYQNSKRDKADARRQELEEERIRLQIQMQQESLAQAQRAAQLLALALASAPARAQRARLSCAAASQHYGVRALLSATP